MTPQLWFAPGDTSPVFATLLDKSLTLCEATYGGIRLWNGQRFVAGASRGATPAYEEFNRQRGAEGAVPSGSTGAGRILAGERIVHIADLADTDEYREGEPLRVATVDLLGARTCVWVGLRQEDRLIGMLFAFRHEVRPFSPKNIALLEAFADQAVIAMENARLLTETREALERQTATAEVLQVINANPGDVVPVFDAILANAHRVCGASIGSLWLYDGELIHAAATRGMTEQAAARMRQPRPPSIAQERMIRERSRYYHSAEHRTDDAENNPEVAASGAQTIMAVPLVKDGRVIGLISARRLETRPFREREIELLENFAAQAVIAMENARLITETREALEQQTATSEILRVINESPGDPLPVYDKILEKAHTVCGADIGTLATWDGTHFRALATLNWPESVAERLRQPFPPEPRTQYLVDGGRYHHTPDNWARPGPHEFSGQTDIRTILVVALRKDDRFLGFISAHRRGHRPYTDKEIALLESFADQAAIAMENARLLGALRQRTAELAERNDAFAERIEQQSATIDVLKAMSGSPGDPQPVFDQIVRRAKELSNALEATLFRYDGELVHHSAVYGEATDPPTPESVAYVNAFPMVPTRGSLSCRAILDRRIIHVRNTETDPELSPVVRELFRSAGLKSQLSIPLLRDDVALGTITLNAEPEGGFSDSQVALLETFAEQAVIAIGSAETYRALQTRTADLQESLEQQTATAEILEVINRSPGDLTPVFDMMLEKAMDLCGISYGIFNTWEGMTRRTRAIRGMPPALREFRMAQPQTDEISPAARHYLRTRKTHHIPDLMEYEGYRNNHPDTRALVDLGGMRTALFVPLVKDDVVIATFNFYRQEVREFSDKDITLLESFAAQAMIAMENARLLGELQDRTAALALRNTEFGEQIEHQGATIDVLKTMSASLGDPQPVFDLILRRAAEVCDAPTANLLAYDGEMVTMPSWYRSDAIATSEAADAFVRQFPMRPTRGTISMRAILDRQIVHARDMATEPGLMEVVRSMHQRSVLSVPLLRDGKALGAITIGGAEAGGFSDTQVELLKTFAEQAVIAIGGAETYRALQTRTADLQESLEQQTATAEILEVINRCPGDLTPVFDMMLEKAMDLCGISYGLFNTWEGMTRHNQAVRGLPPAMMEYRAARMQTVDVSPAVRHYLRTKKTYHVPDLMADEGYQSNHPDSRAIVDLGGMRTALFVPLVKDDVVIAAFNFYRQEVREFTDKEIALLESFVAQAMIAMENARLLGELRDRTAELAERNDAFAERIEHQAATIDVLKEMSASPDNPQPVFDLIVRQARTICRAESGALFEHDGGLMHFRTYFGRLGDSVAGMAAGSPEGAAFAAMFPMVPTRESVPARAIIDKAVIHVRDLATDKEISSTVRGVGLGSRVAVPLLRDGTAIGTIVLGNSAKTDGFSDSQIELLKTFAEQAVIAITSAETYRALRQSLEHQSATIDVLKVISTSTGDTQPVFDAILTQAMKLCGCSFGGLVEFDGELVHRRAMIGFEEERLASYLRTLPPVAPPTRAIGTGRAILDRMVDHVRDIRADPDIPAAVLGHRSQVSVPLMRGDAVIGAISVAHKDVDAFSAAQIELLKTFAEQAVIAIGGAETFRALQDRTAALALRNSEFGERIEQQSATIDVLKAMSASPGDPQPVFEQIVAHVQELGNGAWVAMYEYDGQLVHLRADVTQGLDPDSYSKWRALWPMVPTPESMACRAILEGQVLHLRNLDDVPWITQTVRDSGMKSNLVIPLFRDGRVIGAITLSAFAPGGFTDSQVELLETFAEQAVIAITSAETYRALQDRTAELAERNDAFSERIEQQAATIDVLRSMSASPGDAQPVFEMIAQRAQAFCEADGVAVTILLGDTLHLRTHYGATKALAAEYESFFPLPVDASTTVGRAILTRAPAHNPDLHASTGYLMQGTARSNGLRSNIFVPMLRDGVPVGAIGIGRYTQGEFPPAQVELLTTFAEQAAIAAAAAETFQQLQDRTAALALRNSEFGERIEQQAATIDVLKVMSSTPDDTQPIFDQIVHRALELCDSNTAFLLEYDGTLVHFRAVAANIDLRTPAYASYLAQFPMVPTRGSLPCRAILDGRVLHITDVQSEADLSPAVRALMAEVTYRSQIMIPLMRDGHAIGCISLTTVEPGGFSDSQIALLQTFAEQAVIAIGSVATYRALRERTAELTRSVAELQALEEVLRSVNSSLDLETVLSTIISRAVTLSQADEGTIYEFDDAEEVFVMKSAYGMPEDRVAALRESRIRLGETHLGRAALQREPVHVSDVQRDQTLPDSARAVLAGIHAVLAVPLLKEDRLVGGLVIRRRTVGDFHPSTVTLLQTFAGQSVLAIENARLFLALAERGEEARRARVAAEQALSDLRRTQDRLLQTEKLASLGQLTAGIAHEIKNPLNFVNNFSELSVDLLRELNEVVAPANVTLAEELRAEIDDITATLTVNLEKIAHHGKRADSIVKNMLLHSRTGTSEHWMVGVNSLVEEALNLAYHGERAKTPGFNITMETDLDPKAGEVDAFPQEITRVLLNLMSNGFYAAHKRAKEPGFEPTLKVTTRDLGDQVEIRVRDNGTGIPDAEREKIFEPFFTTKPAGEGTGLGLSLSFDIVVKQHGGGLVVDSRVGAFTEFTITLPRRITEEAAP